MQEIAFAVLNSDLFSIIGLRSFRTGKRCNNSYERNKTVSKILRHFSFLNFSVKHKVLIICEIEITFYRLIIYRVGIINLLAPEFFF